MNNTPFTLKCKVARVENHILAGNKQGAVMERSKVIFEPLYKYDAAKVAGVTSNSLSSITEIPIWIDDPTLVAQFAPGTEFTFELKSAEAARATRAA